MTAEARKSSYFRKIIKKPKSHEVFYAQEKIEYRKNLFKIEEDVFLDGDGSDRLDLWPHDFFAYKAEERVIVTISGRDDDKTKFQKHLESVETWRDRHSDVNHFFFDFRPTIWEIVESWLDRAGKLKNLAWLLVPISGTISLYLSGHLDFVERAFTIQQDRSLTQLNRNVPEPGPTSSVTVPPSVLQGPVRSPPSPPPGPAAKPTPSPPASPPPAQASDNLQKNLQSYLVAQAGPLMAGQGYAHPQLLINSINYWPNDNGTASCIIDGGINSANGAVPLPPSQFPEQPSSDGNNPDDLILHACEKVVDEMINAYKAEQ